MDTSSQMEREARAARNQSMFRSVNERLEELNESFLQITERFTIACECADTSCVEIVEIRAEEYGAVRAEPRHFVVLPGHVYSDVEDVVREADGYVVVEKTGTAAAVAEILDPRGDNAS
jgi:5-bromo-4-chloroindolyl phosphate hydrolysis protein